ncbi:MAG: CPBP family intramembrane glutamic endopeptidase [Yoonia sp.]|uniref:CPBP family intramembrane glutamic endopeptidase n=1 Tax=Yoonia sp. TaxID=2212373 RepID=UPI003EF2FF41
MHDPYGAHRAFISPARASSSLSRVLVMIVVFEIVFNLSPPIFALLLPSDAMVEEFYEGVTAFGTLAQFASFGVAALGFWYLLKALHGRGIATVLGPIDALKTDLVRAGLSVGTLLLVLEVLPPWFDLSEVAYVRDIATWFLVYIPLTLAVLLVQVGTEELFFRGYLQQQFAVLSNSRLVWMGVPSVLFGALHYFNAEGFTDGMLWAIWAMALGVACADLTARTGNLGAAIGLHMANNAFALLLVAIDGWPASGLALFVFPYEDRASYAMGPEMFLTLGTFFQLVTLLLTVWTMWLAARLAIRR